MREPSRLRCRSRYSFTVSRNSMKPSVTVSRKISVETAQNRNVSAALVGPYSPKVKETCHTTSVSRIARTTSPGAEKMPFAHRYINYRAGVQD